MYIFCVLKTKQRSEFFLHIYFFAVHIHVCVQVSVCLYVAESACAHISSVSLLSILLLLLPLLVCIFFHCVVCITSSISTFVLWLVHTYKLFDMREYRLQSVTYIYISSYIFFLSCLCRFAGFLFPYIYVLFSILLLLLCSTS